MSTAIATTPDSSTPPEAACEARVTAISEDGYEYDVATGEVLGLFGSPSDPDRPERFEVVDADGADWVLERMAEAESQVLAIEARKRALVDNLERKASWSRQVLKFLRWRFGPGLEEQARRDIAGTKRKTAVYPHGSVAFRSSKGSVEITDAGAAAEFAYEWAPKSVRMTVGVKGLDEAIAAYEAANGEAPDVSAFAKFHGPSEKASIKTGVAPDPGAGKDAA